MRDEATRAAQVIEHPPLSEAELARSERIMALLSLPDTGMADPDEIARSLAFIPDQLASMAAPPTDAERADLARRLKDALWADYSAADWLTPRFLKDGKPKFALIPTAAAYARVWPGVFYDWQRSRDLARLAARHRLLAAAAKHKRAEEPHAEDALRAAVARRLDALLDVVGREPDDSTWERVAGWLENHGLPKGARQLRDGQWPAADWRDPFFTARLLAQATWEEETKELLSRATVPGMNLLVVGDLARVRMAQARLPLPGEASGWTIVDANGRKIGEVLGPTIDGQLVKPEVLQNVATQMLLRVLMMMTHRQRITGSMYDRPDVACRNVDRLVIDGGRTELARLCGMKPTKAAEIWDAAQALSHVRLRDQRLGFGQLLTTYEVQKGNWHQRSIVELTLSGALGSTFVHTLDTRKGHEKRIVPVPVPMLLPPFKGGRAEWGGQLMLQQLMMRFFKEAANELAQAGGVVLEDKHWRLLFDEAGLRRGLLPDVRDAWIAGKGDRPPVLKLVEGGRFDLGDAYGNERASILLGVEEAKEKAQRAMAIRRRRGGR